jgi:hypothetical protein
MSWKCVLGLHSPSVVSIARKADGLHALCDGCGIPLERNEDGRWRMGLPLAAQAASAPPAR